MATSGTVTFRTNRNEVIKGALRLVQGYDPENAAGPTAQQITDAAEALNLLVKQWEAVGLQIWERRYGVIFVQKAQGLYSLGTPGPGGDHACLTTPLSTGFVQTSLSASAASGASTISVASVSCAVDTVGVPAVTVTSTYNIGIELDSGYVQWTTVNGAPVGTTVTLTATLTGAATSGNTVYCYQTKLMRPMRILDAFVRQVSGTNDIPVAIISRDQYNRFGSKTSPGQGIQLYYDPQTTKGYVYTYPVFNDVSQMLFIEFTKPIDDFASSADDFDLPQEWGAALKFNLALAICPEYEITTEKFKQIEYLATQAFTLVNGYDRESPQSVMFSPNQQMNHNG